MNQKLLNEPKKNKVKRFHYNNIDIL